MESINNICRACQATKDKFTYYLLNNVPRDLYSFCTSIEVLQDDGLPKSLCDTCYNLLTNFSTFKHTCIESNKTLIKLASSVKLDLQPDNGVYDDTKLLLQVEVKAEREDLSHDDYFEDADGLDNKTVAGKQYKRLKRKKSKVKHEKREMSEVQKKKNFCFSCEHCNKRFVDPDRFEGHKLMHEGKPELIRCQPCNKSFSTWYGLSRHKSNEHTSVSLERLRCRLCGKISKSPQTLKIHLARHSDAAVLICDVCGRRFKTKAVLKAHLETHSSVRARSHACPQCSSAFYTRSTLQAHSRRHHGHARYVCHLCSHPYKDKCNLTKHLMMHEGRKRYKCDICQKRFASQSSVVEHKRIHSGERPFACGICEKRFVTKRMMVDHQRIHTGEKPHRCEQCTQAFTQRGTLKRHMRVHEKPPRERMPSLVLGT